MKKVLFATTALVATAGVAAAEVTLSGSAEMGIADANTTIDGVSQPSDVTFFQSVDVRFTMSGETDNGLTFGAVVDLNDAAEQGDVVDIAGAFADFNVFLSGDFGTVTMGDTDGALDWALTEVGGVGSINDAETGHPGYNGNAGLDGFYNGQVLRYDYSVGGFGIAVSAEIDNDGSSDGTTNATTVPIQYDDSVLGIGLRYTVDFGAGSLALGVGYQAADDADAFGASISYSSNGLTVGVSGMQWTDVPIRVADAGTSRAGQFTFYETGAVAAATPIAGTLGGVASTSYQADVDHIGVGVTYEFDAFGIHANWGQYEVTSTAASANPANYESDGVGLAASYDLGGGAVVHFGYGMGERSGTLNGTAFNNEYDSWSLGVAMSF